MTLVFGYENMLRWDGDTIFTRFLQLICLLTFIPKCSSSMFKPKQSRFLFKNWLWFSSPFCLEWISLHPANSLCYTVHMPQILSSDTLIWLSHHLALQSKRMSQQQLSLSSNGAVQRYRVSNYKHFSYRAERIDLLFVITAVIKVQQMTSIFNIQCRHIWNRHCIQ